MELSAARCVAISDMTSKQGYAGRKARCAVTPVPCIGGEHRAYRALTQPFAAHSHRHYVIGRVKEGERELDLNGERMHIAPGDLIVLDPGDVHGCRQASDAPFSYDSVTIAAEVLDDARLRPPKSDRYEALEAFDDLVRCIEGEADGETEVLERTLYLASCLDAAESPSSASSIHEGPALRAFAHLCGHLAEPHAIADLAAAEGISEYALIRAYRRRFSITPLQHLMSLRVECACELLSKGAAPADVAAETGFADQSHLTRIFKQRIGTTPAAYGRMVAGGGVRE